MKKRNIIKLILLASFFFVVGCTDTSVERFRITFIGVNGQVIEEKLVEAGAEPKYPDAPVVEGYRFIGWDKEIKSMTGHVVVKALFEKIAYKVTFIDSLGNKLEEKYYNKNEIITYPIVNEMEGYHFIGFDKTIKTVTEDIVICALYEKNQYTITFIDSFGNKVEEKQYTYLDEIQLPNPIEVEGYHFVRFDKEIDVVKTDATIMMIYEKNVYTITFQTSFGDVISEHTYQYLDEINMPTPPEIDGYQWIGFDKVIHVVTSDAVITALYEEKRMNLSVGEIIIEHMGSTLNLKGEIHNQSQENIKEIIVKANGKNYVFSYQNEDYIEVSVLTTIQQSTNLDIEVCLVLEDGQTISVYQTTYFMEISFIYPNNVSYVDQLEFEHVNSIDKYLESIDLASSKVVYTFNEIKYGGYRGTNELHAYDATNYRSRNSYGFEAGVDKNGLVITTGTLVDLPEGGYILSGHGTAATLLEKNIKIGDYVIYDKTTGSAKLCRDTTLSKLISIRERLLSAKEKIEKAYQHYEALDYQEMMIIFNETALQLNQLLTNYNETIATQLNILASKLHYMVIETNTVQVKSFWHYPMRANGYPENSTKEVQRFLDSVKELGINTIYTNTNFNGGCAYKSAYLKQLKGAGFTYEGYKDYLECFITEAHLRNIRVVAWTNTHICGDGYLPSHSKSSWVMLGYHGENNYGNMYFYDITNPEVQTFLVNVYSELAREYDLDGIEYDFIRYPSSNLYSFEGTISDASKIVDYGYNDGAIALFKEVYHIVGDVKTLILTDTTVRGKWQEFKKANVTKMVHLLSTAIRGANENIMISAAVMTSLSGAIQTYAQDFGSWIQDGYVDNLDPMMYTGSNSYLDSRINSFIKTVNGNATIVVGISPDNSGGDSVTLSEQIKRISKDLLLGWSEFSSRNVYNNPEIIEGLKAIKRAYTVTIYDSKDKIRQSYAMHMLDLIANYYCYVDASIVKEEFVGLFTSLYYDTITMDEVGNKLLMIQNETIKNKLFEEYQLIQNLIKG